MAKTAEATNPADTADPAPRPQPATPSTARAINDRAALDLFVTRGPLTALALAEATGLAKPTVADLLARLQESGLVTQIGEVKTDKRGPNAKLYALAAKRACVAGIDARAEVVHLSLAGLAGQHLAATTVQVPPNLPEDAVLDRVADSLLDLAAQTSAPLMAVTIGMPGLVDPTTGQVGRARMSPSWHTRLAEAVRARTGLPPAAVHLENEVNLAAIAEQRLLAEQGIDTFALLWLGAGVGAAVVLDGRLRRGASGGAGEIGYLPVPGPLPRPGAWTGKHTDGGATPGGLPDSPPDGLPGGPPDGPSAEPAHRPAAADRGPDRQLDRGGSAIGALIDAKALAELTAALPPAHRMPAVADRVVFGVAAFAVTLDPGVVVLGGENGAAGGAELAALVERRLSEICPVPARVLPTAVPGNPILAGAVATALDRARAELWP
jgi:predicted NBD/HSP70 family sugar kinase